MSAVLSVTPIAADHAELDRILGFGRLWRVATLAAARDALAHAEFPVLISEASLQPGDWKDLLLAAQTMAHPPALIVTSRQADESLWAEALNLGAYDVLAKPFYEAEVTRVVNLASLRWHREFRSGFRAWRSTESAAQPVKRAAITVKKAAGAL